MRILSLFSASLLLAATTSFAQIVTLPLWPNGNPEPWQPKGAERDITTEKDRLVDGRKFIHLTDVSKPTLAVYKPEASRDTGAAVLVFPGGGYRIVSIDLEGTEVCTWLNSIGVTCVLVKYRVMDPTIGHYPEHTEDLEDAQQAMRLTRAHAAEWKIDPKRVGALGFSAGAHLSVVLGNHPDFRGPGSAASTADTKPNFIVLIYPGLLVDQKDLMKLNPTVAPTAATPPTFLLQAADDYVHEENSLVYFQALKEAKVPAELHIYGEGGHGFGLRPTDLPATHWPALVETWLHTIHVLGTPAK